MLKQQRVLVVDDHENTRETIKDVVEIDNVVGKTAKNVIEALALLDEKEFDLVITDLRLPDGSGMQVLEHSKEVHPDTPVVIITGFGSEQTAVDAMKKGAADYLTKPLDLHRMRTVIDNALRYRGLTVDNRNLKKQLAEKRSLTNITGNSEPMRRIKQMVKQVAGTNATILLTGESGVGKEVVVDAIQAMSDRAGKSYIKVNAAALPRDLLESELFGHEKGAFTGAIKKKKGRFELADEGTLFLDEIGEMPVGTQVKLLRVIQERAFERVGGTETLQTDVRLLCATNQDLEKAIEEGRFRRDLYYRINVIRIEIPPLRERRADIVPLTGYFLERYGGGKSFKISPEAMRLLAAYDWPGNVRELENVIQRATLLCTSDTIDLEHFPPELLTDTLLPAAGGNLSGALQPDDAQGLISQNTTTESYRVGRKLEDVEKTYIHQTLDTVGWNKTKAARQLGIGLKTLYRKIEKFHLEQKSVPEI